MPFRAEGAHEKFGIFWYTFRFKKPLNIYSDYALADGELKSNFQVYIGLSHTILIEIYCVICIYEILDGLSLKRYAKTNLMYILK